VLVLIRVGTIILIIGSLCCEISEKGYFSSLLFLAGGLGVTPRFTGRVMLVLLILFCLLLIFAGIVLLIIGSLILVMTSFLSWGVYFCNKCNEFCWE